MIRKLVDRLDHYAELRGRIQRHIQETEQQAARLESCIERRGEKTSTLKDVAGKMTATVQGLSGTVAEDEVVKAHLAHYTFEHYEIASYRILLATADEAGDADPPRVRVANPREDDEMAALLAENLPATGGEYRQR